MTESSTHDAKAENRSHVYTVTVNEHPVHLRENKMTGQAIKQAAIAQGAELEQNFELSVKQKHGGYDIVGDDDTVRTKDGLEFIAVGTDDNS